MGICYVVGAGEVGTLDLNIAQDDLVIAADAGFRHLIAHGIMPHLAVGDFDSLGDVPADVPVERHPVCKDETDMALAVQCGLDRGYTRFVLLGGTGGRTDHTLANIQLLAWLAHRGCRAVLLGTDCAATVICDGGTWQMQQASGTVSVFCHSDRAEGVSIEGLRYTLDCATLRNDVALGVSNAFTGAPATVHVAHGTLLLWWETDCAKNTLKCIE